MHWFFLALLAPLFWASVNIIDEFLISRYYKKENDSDEDTSSVGSLVLFSALFGLVIAGVVALIKPEVFLISGSSVVTLLVAGALAAVWIIAYFIALEKAEASSIAPWFQTIPIFGFILGFFLLQEVPTLMQVIGCCIIIVGAILLSFDIRGHKIAFRGKAVWFMVLAAFLIALTGVLFKSVAIENNFWISTFWEAIGMGITGVLLFLFHTKYRTDFLSKFKTAGKQIIGVNLVNEILNSVGTILNNLALVLAPVALVFSVNSIQPLFVFLFSIVITKYWPHIGKEDMNKKALILKTIAIVLVVGGSIVVSFS